MPSKKKKYNSRFPPARIKKIMQTDEEIGKVAAAVPVLISKCLEMFLSSLLTKAGDVTRSRRAKTMTRSHLKECILSETMFDFLKDHVANIPDVQNEDEPSGSFYPAEKEQTKKIVRKRSLPKVKKTPKKRAKLGHSTNNNESDAETDSVEDASENGSGNEFSSSFSSQGLLSPSAQKKIDPQISFSSASKQAVVPPVEGKPAFHIPLDALMSSDKIPETVEIKKPVVVSSSTDDAEGSSSQDDEGRGLTINERNNHQEPYSTDVSSHVAKGSSAPQTSDVQSASAPRRGVIVANTVAYPVAPPPTVTASPSHINSNMQGHPPFSPPGHAAYRAEGPSTSGVVRPKHTPERSRNHAEKSESQTENMAKISPNTSHGNTATNREDRTQETVLPPIVPPAQPGSMLSFLYSSVSMPISSLNMPTTVSTPMSSSSPQETYAYTPLTQHRFAMPGTELLRPRLPAEIPHPRLEYRKTFPNQDRKLNNNAPPLHGETSTHQAMSSSYVPYAAYPFSPYNPNVTASYGSQRHYLGYSQAILTPSGHPVPDMSSHYPAHPALCLVKPAPAAVSDDEDYDA